jgi:phenylpyruvate tautomerase PptA (4-oxalocrotonate tautomerase family)
LVEDADGETPPVLSQDAAPAGTFGGRPPNIPSLYAVPSLQLDVPAKPGSEPGRELAAELTAIYAEIMNASPEIVTVVIREAAVWHDGTPSALLMCDVRRGRPVETRAELARRLTAACERALGISYVKVEFTQHPGDEMWHPHLGGFNEDWS